MSLPALTSRRPTLKWRNAWTSGFSNCQLIPGPQQAAQQASPEATHATPQTAAEATATAILPNGKSITMTQRQFAVKQADGRRHQVLLGWRLKLQGKVDEVRLAVLSSLLVDHSGSPLRQVLEQSELGAEPSPFLGGSGEGPHSLFLAGLDGTSINQATEIAQLIWQKLEDVAQQGFPAEDVQGSMDQIELSLRANWRQPHALWTQSGAADAG